VTFVSIQIVYCKNFDVHFKALFTRDILAHNIVIKINF